MTNATCRNCRWAEWERTEKGSVRTSRYGRCTYPIRFRVPVLPACVREPVKQPVKQVIWWHSADECPVFGDLAKKARTGTKPL